MSKENTKTEILKAVDPIIELDGNEFVIHFGMQDMQMLSKQGHLTKPMSERDLFGDSVDILSVALKNQKISIPKIKELIETALDNNTLKCDGKENQSLQDLFITLIMYIQDRAHELRFI